MTPSETTGPYPSLSDVVRSDSREDRSGTPVTLAISVVNANGGCTVSGDPGSGYRATFQVGINR